MSPCQVLSDVDTEEPEDSLHSSCVDGDGGMFPSRLLPYDNKETDRDF